MGRRFESCLVSHLYYEGDSLTNNTQLAIVNKDLLPPRLRTQSEPYFYFMGEITMREWGRVYEMD
jgi:hypothetical protein